MILSNPYSCFFVLFFALAALGDARGPSRNPALTLGRLWDGFGRLGDSFGRLGEALGRRRKKEEGRRKKEGGRNSHALAGATCLGVGMDMLGGQ